MGVFSLQQAKSKIMGYSFDELYEKIGSIEIMVQQILHKPTEKSTREDSEILDVKQAAVLLKYSIRTIYGKAEQGLIPAFKKGSRWYFFKNELLEWIKVSKIKSDADIITQADHLLTSKRRRA